MVEDGAQNPETALAMLEKAVDQGCAVQYLRPHHRVFTIASDARNLGERSPNLGDARDYLARYFSEDELNK
ncbi:MAG: hypothetical protein GJ671_02755 [Alteromonadaceae bacterium]|nr:hypothetical protein [Alteromonadaceae bacterium]